MLLNQLCQILLNLANSIIVYNISDSLLYDLLKYSLLRLKGCLLYTSDAADD